MNKNKQNNVQHKPNMHHNTINGLNNKMINGDNFEYNHFEQNFITILAPENIIQNEYSENYYKYIGKFKELEGYLFCKLFDFKEKDYNFTSTTLKFGKAIIDWTIGSTLFPIRLLEQFQQEMAMDFDLKENEIINQRWTAMSEYFKGNLQKSLELYQSLLTRIKHGEYIESYFKDDILIDGRNIDIQYEEENNRYKPENEFQKEIDKNKHILANPMYDRIKINIYESAHKSSFDYKYQSKYTIIYSNGIKNICNEIQNLIYVTIFWGSITHLQLSRKLLAEVLHLYADALNDEKLYLSTLKMLILENNQKKFKKFFDSLRYKFSSTHSTEFINSLLLQRNSVINFYITEYNCILYELFGRYLSDPEYLKLENEMLNKIEITSKINISNIYNILKALKCNITRISNKEKMFNIFLEYFENNYSRFYMEIAEIINSMELEYLTKNELVLFGQVLDKLVMEKERHNLNIINSIVNYRNITKLDKYSDIINESSHNIIVNSISKNEDNYIIVKNIIDIMEYRAEMREKSPYVYTGYANEYTIGRDAFSPENYTAELENLILEKLFPLAVKVLASKNQSRYEKIKHIRILSNLLIEHPTSKYKDIISNIISKMNLESINDEAFRSRTEQDLITNKRMLDFLLDNISQENMINDFCETILSQEDCILEVLRCFDFINKKIKLNNTFLEKQLYIIFKYSYNTDFDIDVKCKSYSILRILLKTSYKINMLNFIKTNANICTFEEAREIVNILKNESIEKQYIKEIKEKLLENNNYNIRGITNKYL